LESSLLVFDGVSSDRHLVTGGRTIAAFRLQGKTPSKTLLESYMLFPGWNLGAIKETYNKESFSFHPRKKTFPFSFILAQPLSEYIRTCPEK
jgi:hypothetical protein